MFRLASCFIMASILAVVSTSVAEAQAGCKGTCQTCPAPWQHAVLQGQESGISGDHDCVTGECDVHNGCEPMEEDADVEDFAAAVAVAAGNSHLRLTKSFGSSAYFNQQRGSVQVRGCSGQIIANIQLTEVQLKALRGD